MKPLVSILAAAARDTLRSPGLAGALYLGGLLLAAIPAAAALGYSKWIIGTASLHDPSGMRIDPVAVYQLMAGLNEEQVLLFACLTGASLALITFGRAYFGAVTLHFLAQSDMDRSLLNSTRAGARLIVSYLILAIQEYAIIGAIIGFAFTLDLSDALLGESPTELAETITRLATGATALLVILPISQSYKYARIYLVAHPERLSRRLAISRGIRLSLMRPGLVFGTAFASVIVLLAVASSARALPPDFLIAQTILFAYNACRVFSQAAGMQVVRLCEVDERADQSGGGPKPSEAPGV